MAINAQVIDSDQPVAKVDTDTAKQAKLPYVTSVNGMRGDVEINIPEEVAAAAPVKKVNNKTGNVILSASDVGALPDTGGTVDGDVTVTGRYISSPKAANSNYPPFETTINNAPESGDPAPSGNNWATFIGARDKGGALRSYVRHFTQASGVQGIQIETRRFFSSGTLYNGLMLGIDALGNLIVNLGSTEALTAWQKALGLAFFPGDVLTGSGGYAQYSGAWFSQTHIRFTIPTRKSCVGLSATASGGLWIRGGGKYSGAISIDGSNLTAECSCNETGVAVALTFATAPSYAPAAYYAVAIQLANNFTITFS